MLRTKIKAGAITNLTDARYFAAWDVEWMGFCLDPGSTEYISLATVKAIKEWVEGPQVIGEFGLQTIEEIHSAISLLDLQAIQLHPFSPVTEIKAAIDIPIFQELVPEIPQSLEALLIHCQKHQEDVDCFVLNCSKNNVRWSEINESPYFNALKQICESYPVILDISSTPDELSIILDSLRLAGLNIKGGEEEKVGFKSFDEVDDIFESLEVY